MTWQRAGFAAAIAFGLTLVETVPHAATLALACIALYVIGRLLAGHSILADGAPVTWRSGAPVAAVLLGLTLVQTWPHAATLGIGVAVIRAVCARLDAPS